MDLGTVYPSMEEFRVEGCPWHLIGNRQPDGKTIMVTTLIAGHNCTSSARRRTTTPTSAWVASKAVVILQKHTNMGPKELRDKLEEQHKCVINYDTVCRGRKIALKKLYGSWEDSFQMLFNWKAEVMKRSPDSVIEIGIQQVDENIYFHRFFCALGSCIEGFRNGYRPYLSIDSTALNGRWNGHLAAATAIDGHNWMYPVAFGFIDGETTDNWTWFMTQLHNALGDVPILAICTDACKGLEKAVNDVFPNAEQRECFRHLMQNFIKRWGGDAYSKMYPAARAYRVEVFQYFFNSIVESNTEVFKWLQDHHKLKRMRSAFDPAIKCDYVTNNLVESFNNWIKDWKDLPVVELADKIREMIMVLWNKRRRIAEKLHGKILPAVVHQLKMKTRGLGHLYVVKAYSLVAEVWDSTTTHNRHVVKPYLNECTCLEWQHTGKPCQHALALITAQQALDVKLEDFVHEYYSVQRFKNAYYTIIEPLPDRTQWPNVDLPFVVGAPLDKKTAGRYRKLRIKGFLEGGGSKGKKAAKEAANEADKEATNEADKEATNEANKFKKKMIRGKRKCKGCGEKRKPRKNTTKYGDKAKVPSQKKQKTKTNIDDNGATPNVQENEANLDDNGAAPNVQENIVAVQSPSKPTKESIMQDSPIRVTRSQLAILMGEGGTDQAIFTPQEIASKKVDSKEVEDQVN